MTRPSIGARFVCNRKYEREMATLRILALMTSGSSASSDLNHDSIAAAQHRFRDQPARPDRDHEKMRTHNQSKAGTGTTTTGHEQVINAARGAPKDPPRFIERLKSHNADCSSSRWHKVRSNNGRAADLKLCREIPFKPL